MDKNDRDPCEATEAKGDNFSSFLHINHHYLCSFYAILTFL